MCMSEDFEPRARQSPRIWVFLERLASFVSEYFVLFTILPSAGYEAPGMYTLLRPRLRLDPFCLAKGGSCGGKTPYPYKSSGPS